ncbi:MAG: transposase family protein [Lachnospiraceae bacterium]|nr:transposase family protein [Lachnospiraceae bacterium]
MEYNVFGSQIDLQQFYPEKLKIKKITADNESGIVLKMYTESQECCCPKCKTKSLHKHDSYERRVQDLPILGHATWLYVNAYEYECDNPDCDVKTFVEDLNGFINYYGRATDRLIDFLCTLALETSCEASAKIMKSVGIKISGDTSKTRNVKMLSAKICCMSYVK